MGDTDSVTTYQANSNTRDQAIDWKILKATRQHFIDDLLTNSLSAAVLLLIGGWVVRVFSCSSSAFNIKFSHNLRMFNTIQMRTEDRSCHLPNKTLVHFHGLASSRLQI